MLSRQNARRSLIVCKSLNKGDILSNESLTWKRPGTGIEPSEIDKVIGRKINKDLDEDHIITWEDLE